jgi:hypothetical protein
MYIHAAVKTSNITNTDTFINTPCVLYVATIVVEINTNMSVQCEETLISPLLPLEY